MRQKECLLGVSVIGTSTFKYFSVYMETSTESHVSIFNPWWLSISIPTCASVDTLKAVFILDLISFREITFMLMDDIYKCISRCKLM